MVKTFMEVVILFTLMGLGGLAVISFVAQVGIDNNANQTILDEPFVNKTFFDIGGSIESSAETAGAQRKSVERETVEIPPGSFLLVTVIGTALRFGDIISAFYNITVGLVFQYIGFESGVSQVLATIIITIIIFTGWKAFKTGT